jgi:hypothetical protein
MDLQRAKLRVEFSAGEDHEGLGTYERQARSTPQKYIAICAKNRAGIWEISWRVGKRSFGRGVSKLELRNQTIAALRLTAKPLRVPLRRWLRVKRELRFG